MDNSYDFAKTELKAKSNTGELVIGNVGPIGQRKPGSLL